MMNGNNMITASQTSFFGKPRITNLIVALLMLLGFGIRMLDLTDLPFDSYPIRQLFSIVKARGMYYQFVNDVPEWQRELAIEQWKAKATIEPPVIETIVVGLYLVFGEHFWFGRVVASIFWLLGGFALVGLAKRIASMDGAILALAYYLFIEFGILTGRSFQPDPLMIGLTLSALWAFVCWHDEKNWKWTIIAGFLSGMAIFVKNVAVFPLLVAFALVILKTDRIKQAIKDPKVWMLAIITALPTAIYTINGLYISKELDTTLDLRIIPSLWSSPAFYVRWINIIGNTVGFGSLLLALFGIFLSKPGRDRALLLGTFLGYLVYGFVFPYHITTHTYYQLPLIIFISLSFTVVGKVFFQKMTEINGSSLFVRVAVVGILLFGIGSQMWDVRVELLKDDYRGEVQFWEALGDKLGHTTPVVGLTQDYGNRLEYFGWQRVDDWPTTGDQNLRELAGKAKSFDDIFKERTTGKKFFVVTLFKQFEDQPELKDKLYSSYPILEQTPDYIIFDLEHPLE